VKAIGDISKIWGIRSYTIAKLYFNQKYPFIYQFSARKNIDQPLITRSDSLSNFNRKLANKYKAGLGLQYLDKYLKDNIIKKSLNQFYELSQTKKIETTGNDFKVILESNTDKDLHWFFNDYVQTNKNENITSNILPLKESKNCRCLKTGKLIKELKYDSNGNIKDPLIKGQQPTLMVAKDINTGEWIPCVMFIHGKTYNGFITEKTKPFSKNIKTEMTFTLHAGKKGSVPFLIPVDFEYNELSWEEYLNKYGINDAEYIESFDKWVEGVNSRLNKNEEMEVETEVEPINDNPFYD
jgi:hypothetical protein